MRRLLLLSTIFSAACAIAPPFAAQAAEPCHAGAYHLSDGRLVSVGGSVENALRYLMMSGESGRLYLQKDGSFAGGPGWGAPPPPIAATLSGACGSPNVKFSAPGIPSQNATLLSLRTRTQQFSSGDVSLRGRLVVPAGRGKVPLVVLVHGSEDTSAVDSESAQYWLPAQGVAVFVYDKRGTGQSAGKYTQDFDVLAGDAVAALREAKRELGSRVGQAGFWGGSQGGWVAPLAAARGKADFVIADYGLAQTPLDQEREQVISALRRDGYGPDVLKEAHEITDATGQVAASHFTAGFEALDAVKAKYGKESWIKSIQGEYSGSLLSYPTDVIKKVGPSRDQGTSWTYDPLPTLKSLKIPMLWVLAGNDIIAPSATTLGILRHLQQTKPRLDIALFPAADHGMLRFVEKSRERQTLGYARSYQPLILRWIKGDSLRNADDVVLYPGSVSRTH